LNNSKTDNGEDVDKKSTGDDSGSDEEYSFGETPKQDEIFAWNYKIESSHSDSKSEESQQAQGEKMLDRVYLEMDFGYRNQRIHQNLPLQEKKLQIQNLLRKTLLKNHKSCLDNRETIEWKDRTEKERRFNEKTLLKRPEDIEYTDAYESEFYKDEKAVFNRVSYFLP